SFAVRTDTRRAEQGWATLMHYYYQFDPSGKRHRAREATGGFVFGTSRSIHDIMYRTHVQNEREGGGGEREEKNVLCRGGPTGQGTRCTSYTGAYRRGRVHTVSWRPRLTNNMRNGTRKGAASREPHPTP